MISGGKPNNSVWARYGYNRILTKLSRAPSGALNPLDIYEIITFGDANELEIEEPCPVLSAKLVLFCARNKASQS